MIVSSGLISFDVDFFPFNQFIYCLQLRKSRALVSVLQYIQCTVFQQLDFSQNIMAHFSLLALLKLSHAVKKRRSDKCTSFLERH